MIKLIRDHPIRTANLLGPCVSVLMGYLQTKGIVGSEDVAFTVKAWGTVVVVLTGIAGFSKK